MLPKDTLQEIVKLTQQAAGPTVLVSNEAGIPASLIPAGYSVASLEQYYPPKRIKQTVNLVDVGSFCDYVNRFKTDNTLMFATCTPDSIKVVAILDYHEPKNLPAYCSHRAVYEAIKTPEWALWLANDGQAKSQLQFATFLEDNDRLFVDPSGADLIEMAKSIEGTNDAAFASTIRLDNGSVQCNFSEEVNIKGGGVTQKDGSVEIPNRITAGFALFEGGEQYKIQARLKVRLQNSKLAMWYETIAKPVIIRDNIKTVLKTISDKTQILPLLGTE